MRVRYSDRSNRSNHGRVVSIKGSVIDIRFPDKLPEIHNQLVAGTIVIEVLIHLNQEVVRGIALTPIQGLVCGAVVIDMGHPLRV